MKANYPTARWWGAVLAVLLVAAACAEEPNRTTAHTDAIEFLDRVGEAGFSDDIEGLEPAAFARLQRRACETIREGEWDTPGYAEGYAIGAVTQSEFSGQNQFYRYLWAVSNAECPDDAIEIAPFLDL